jgi:putative oligomerization/nucleic acid binding protein
VAYLTKAIIGFALFVGGLVLFNVKLVQLLEIGTCASGNTPYAIRNPCPAGTGTAILLLTGGVFASLIGAFIFALRGEPPWSRGGGHSVSTYAALWGIGFTGTGAVSLVTGLSDDSLGAGGELGAIIVGATFLVMGVPALLVAIWSLVSGLRSRDERAMGPTGSLASSMGTFTTSPPSGAFQTRQSVPASRSATGAADRIAKLKTLSDLRQSGALTEQEFEREKARVLAES